MHFWIELVHQMMMCIYCGDKKKHDFYFWSFFFLYYLPGNIKNSSQSCFFQRLFIGFIYVYLNLCICVLFQCYYYYIISIQDLPHQCLYLGSSAKKRLNFCLFGLLFVGRSTKNKTYKTDLRFYNPPLV